MTTAGFPHSEICGSMDICSSPQLIAACHVLRRLLMPRHSPCALYSLTNRLYNQKADLYLKGLNEFSSTNKLLEIPFTPEGSSRPMGLKIIDEGTFRLGNYGHNGSDNYMLKDFAEAILNNKPSPLGIKEALAMTLPGIYAALSAREGGALKEIKYPWSK